MNVSRRYRPDEHLKTGHARGTEHHQAGLQCLPSAKQQEECQRDGNAEERPQPRLPVYDALPVFRQSGHHPFCESVVFYLLLCSLLEEILYQYVFIIGHIRFPLSS